VQCLLQFVHQGGKVGGNLFERQGIFRAGAAKPEIRAGAEACATSRRRPLFSDGTRRPSRGRPQDGRGAWIERLSDHEVDSILLPANA